MHAHIPALVIVLAAAVAAPLIGELTRRFGLSIVVIEVALGVAIGPQGFDWATSAGAVTSIAKLGMAFLFFLAGLEIDLVAIRGKPLLLAFAGWFAAITLALVAAYAVHSAGIVDAWLVIGIALSTTALGVLVPMLRDSGMLESPFGRYVMAAGVVGELGPIIAMSILLSEKNSVGIESLLILAFVAVVILVAWAMVRGSAIPQFLSLLRRTMTQSSQLPVRGVVLVIAVMVVLAEDFGLDLALGALAAGMVLKFVTQDAESHLLHDKLDALGFGFLVPVFFISSGMKLDVMAVFGSASGLMLSGAIFVFLLLVRIPQLFFMRNAVSGRESIAVCLYSATTLSLIVALTEIAVTSGAMRPQEASPLVMAGVLSVILFPLLAQLLLGRRAAHDSGSYSDHDGL